MKEMLFLDLMPKCLKSLEEKRATKAIDKKIAELQKDYANSLESVERASAGYLAKMPPASHVVPRGADAPTEEMCKNCGHPIGEHYLKNGYWKCRKCGCLVKDKPLLPIRRVR